MCHSTPTTCHSAPSTRGRAVPIRTCGIGHATLQGPLVLLAFGALALLDLLLDWPSHLLLLRLALLGEKCEEAAVGAVEVSRRCSGSSAASSGLYLQSNLRFVRQICICTTFRGGIWQCVLLIRSPRCRYAA